VVCVLAYDTTTTSIRRNFRASHFLVSFCSFFFCFWLGMETGMTQQNKSNVLFISIRFDSIRFDCMHFSLLYSVVLRLSRALRSHTSTLYITLYKIVVIGVDVALLYYCVLFCFVLFCFILFYFILFCFVLFCFVLFCFVVVIWKRKSTDVLTVCKFLF
jgi:hypothetical protein